MGDEVGDKEDTGKPGPRVRREHSLKRRAERPEVEELDQQRMGNPKRRNADQRHRVGEVQRQIPVERPCSAGRESEVLDNIGPEDADRERSRNHDESRTLVPAADKHRQRAGRRRQREHDQVLTRELLEPLRCQTGHFEANATEPARLSLRPLSARRSPDFEHPPVCHRRTDNAARGCSATPSPTKS